MPAFNEKQLDELEHAVRLLYSRSIRHKASGLTHEDVKTIIVRPEHHRVVDEARELFGSEASTTVEFRMPDSDGRRPMALMFELDVNKDHPGFPFPNYAGTELFGDPECEARKKLAAWVKWRARAGREWCLVHSVLRELNRRCKRPAQVRYFWPSIVSLMAMSGDAKLQAAGDKLRAYKALADLPAVCKSLAEACAVTNAIVSRGLLYPSTLAPAQLVTVTLNSFDPSPRPWRPDTRCELIQPA